MIVIAVKGEKHNGKSLVSQLLRAMLLKEYAGARSVHVESYGDRMKQALYNVFGFTEEQLNGDEKEDMDRSTHLIPREVMKWFATEVMRKQLPAQFPEYGKLWGEGVWAKRLIDGKLKPLYELDFNGIVIIDDLRYAIDDKLTREWVSKLPTRSIYQTWHVSRDNIKSGDNHSSETELYSIPTDYSFCNDSNLTNKQFNDNLLEGYRTAEQALMALVKN